MTIELDIDGDGFHAIADAYELLGRRSQELIPAGYKVRDRWHESEKRLFASNRLAPRAASTVKRYRYPVRHTGDEQLHRDTGGRPMRFTGLTERTLTTSQAIGQRDNVAAVSDTHQSMNDDGVETKRRPGGLNVTVGIKQNGPIFYAAINNRAGGSRPARKVVVFDREAHGDSAGDILEYLLASTTRRT